MSSHALHGLSHAQAASLTTAPYLRLQINAGTLAPCPPFFHPYIITPNSLCPHLRPAFYPPQWRERPPRQRPRPPRLRPQLGSPRLATATSQRVYPALTPPPRSYLAGCHDKLFPQRPLTRPPHPRPSPAALIDPPPSADATASNNRGICPCRQPSQTRATLFVAASIAAVRVAPSAEASGDRKPAYAAGPPPSRPSPSSPPLKQAFAVHPPLHPFHFARLPRSLL